MSPSGVCWGHARQLHGLSTLTFLCFAARMLDGATLVSFEFCKADVPAKTDRQGPTCSRAAQAEPHKKSKPGDQGVYSINTNWVYFCNQKCKYYTVGM